MVASCTPSTLCHCRMLLNCCLFLCASQLCRVVKVRQRILSLLNGAHSLCGEAVWSRRRLITWCRCRRRMLLNFCMFLCVSQLCRVVKVRQRILSLLNGAHSLRGEAVWSRRRLITWCRANLCTPLDDGLLSVYSADVLCV